MTTVDKIKAVSLKRFAEGGYEGTSLAHIAEDVGIKKPSIYNHFASKDELFLTVFQDVVWDYVTYIKNHELLATGGSVEEILRGWLFQTCQYYLEHEENVSLLKRAMLFPHPPLKERLRSEFLASEEATSKILLAVFQRGRDEGVIREEAIEDLLATFYCLIDGLFVQMFYYERERFEGKLESAWTIFWSGIRE